MRKGINISHVNIENMGGHDQSQVKIKFKKLEKTKSVPKNVPKSHNDDSGDCWYRIVPFNSRCSVCGRSNCRSTFMDDQLI